VDFLVYSRGAPAAAESEHDRALDEEHWSYMDGFAAGMIARGPTLAADRERWTGSLHILDLPDADAARAFAEHEPYNRAGLFAEHVIRRFENLLGRTMWEHPGASEDPRFFVIAHRPAGQRRPAPAFPALTDERLIVHGALRMPGDASPAGVALAFQAPTRAAAEVILRAGSVDEHVELELHDWELGGRR
jgi:uncharacterized protein YciI